MTLTAEVEEVSASYYPGVVHAVLRVEPTGGEKTAFRVECVCMPKCTAGERVQARFALEVPARTQQLSSYADGIALSGEYLSGMKHLGPSESFRAKTARLQKRLSAALRKGMAQRAGRLGLRPTGCPHLAGRGRRLDDAGQQLRRL